MRALPGFVEPLGDGIFAIDTGFQRPKFDAAYLIVENGRAAFIDTGTNFALPRHAAALAALDISAEAVDYVIATHVHLDHAGGAGTLMQHLPDAKLVVHPRGARHLIDPGELYRGALAVYGQQEMDRSYGRLIGVEADRVLKTADGMVLELAGRPLFFIDSPGHARHHHCIWDERSQGWFTGDTFGLSYREFDTPQGAYILPTTTPVQFEPDALHRSVQRMLAKTPRQMFLTHFGAVTDVPRLAEALLSQVDEMVCLGSRLRDAPDRHAALKTTFTAIYVERALAHGVTFSADKIKDLLALDIELNAQGFGVWLDRYATTAP